MLPKFSDLSSRYKPELVERMKRSECYRCDERGHWTWDCPFPVGYVKNKPISRSSNHDYPLNPPRIFCRCGHGPCVVVTPISGRKFYACPIKRGKPCGGFNKFIQWCDNPIDESYMQPPPYKYPECECGAGVCRKVNDSDVDKYYFACPVRQGHGSCDYKVWEDELLDNKSIVPIQKSSQKHYDMGEGGDLLVEHSKGMRMMVNCETPLLMAVSERPERDNAAPNAAPSSCIDFPEFEVADDLQEVVNSVPCDAAEKEALLLSRRSRPSKISCRQNLFGSNSFAGVVTDASFGRCTRGWLGCLIFLHPSRSLEFPAPRPFFCCIFPSFDKILVPKQAIIGDGPCEHNQLAISNLNEHAQLSSSGCRCTEVSRDVVSVSPIKSQGSKRKPMSKAERQRRMVLVTLQELLMELESLDPGDHESMRVAAEDTFALLHGLSADYKHFSDHVWDFIGNASAVANIDKSMENSLTLEECNQLIEKERGRIAQIQEECLNAEALLEASNQNRQRLREEVSHLEAILHEKQNQLKSCESESLKLETRLGDLKRRMMEADTTLKDRAEEVELARRLNEERQTKQLAAKTALEKAKQELEN